MGEAYLTQQIETQQREYDDPYRQIDLSVEQIPVIGLVGDAEELEAQRDLDEAQNHLH